MLTMQEKIDFKKLLTAELEKYKLYGKVLLREYEGEIKGIFIWVLLSEEIGRCYSLTVAMEASLLRHFSKRNVHLPLTLRYAQPKWQKKRREALGAFLPIERLDDQIMFDVRLFNIILREISREWARVYRHYGIKGQPREIETHWLN